MSTLLTMNDSPLWFHFIFFMSSLDIDEPELLFIPELPLELLFIELLFIPESLDDPLDEPLIEELLPLPEELFIPPAIAESLFCHIPCRATVWPTCCERSDPEIMAIFPLLCSSMYMPLLERTHPMMVLSPFVFFIESFELCAAAKAAIQQTSINIKFLFISLLLIKLRADDAAVIRHRPRLAPKGNEPRTGYADQTSSAGCGWRGDD